MESIKLADNKGQTISVDSKALVSLSEKIHGQVITSGHEQYDAARTVWNGLIAKKPGAIVQCRGVADVMAAVQFARSHRLKIFVRGGGHNVSGACLSDHGYVVDLSAMRAVRVDPHKKRARVEGGARLGDLDHETQAFGLAAPVGVVSATGVAGLTLHGGMGWLLRNHGLSIDNLHSVDIVTSDGKLITADHRRNEDLFWAVRGGGGNFGVVTSIEFELHAVGPRVWFAVPIYPFDRAQEVMQAFHAIMQDAPDELMGLGVYWSAPELPEVPKKYHGKPVLFLLACYSGPLEAGEKAIAPLRRIGTPIADLSAPRPWVDVQKFLDDDYPDGAFYYWKSIYLDRLDDQVLQILGKFARERPSPISSIDVWALGGAMRRVEENATAFSRRKAPYMIGIEANWSDAKDNDLNIEWARRLHAELKESAGGGDYLNFGGFFEDQGSMLSGAYGANLKKLKSVKREYDPENLFAGAINIHPE